MRMNGCFIRTSLFALTSTLTALAQTGAPPTYPPPVPPPTGVPAPAATTTAPYQTNPYAPPPYTQPAPPPSGTYPTAPPGATAPPPATAPGAPAGAPPTAAQPVPWQQQGAPPPPMTVDVNASSNAALGVSNSGMAEVPPAEGSTESSEPVDREYSWYRHNSLLGGTGLLHTISADSGAPGTFRLSLLSNYYSGSGFLCPSVGQCPARPGITGTQDTLDRVGADLTLSATLLPFLEAYAGMHSHATSDTFGSPQLLQVLGDTNFGVKGFIPRQDDSIFSVGALGELRLMNGSGSVGIHTANVALRALGTLDLNNRRDPDQRIPLRFHANFGYLFDNSSSIVEQTEKSRGNVPVSRIERFGLDINRVDSLFIGFGGEFVNPVVQPFAEWTVDVPSNRQGYVCRPSVSSAGDGCLGNRGGFGATPSRLTLGLRTTPWLKGLNATLAFDIGTGGTSTFIEELAPQVPWNLYLGIGFAYDTLLNSAPAPAIAPTPEVVQLPPLPERHIVGVVIDEKSLQPVPNALVHFQGRPLTGLISRADGSFESANLEPGEYAFTVTAEGYKDGACSTTVAAFAPPPIANTNPGAAAPLGPYDSSFGAQPGAMGQAPQLGPGAPGPGAPGPGVMPGTAMPPNGGPTITSMQCLLKPAPVVGIIQGTLVDAESNSAVPGARITVRDARGREIEVQTDDTGNFRFENVPIGTVHLSVDANGYLPSATDIEVKQKGEQRASLTLNKRPKRANVSVTGKEIKLNSQIHFGTNSANILPDSEALIQEIASVMSQHAEIRRVEIEGHTDDSGPAAYNKRLSQERADAVRSALVGLGVDANRLTARGYGAEKPVVPNTSNANRSKNRRVQFLILER